MAGRGYIREQRHLCHAGYQEVDIYPVSDQEHRASMRAKKQAAQRLVQANLNARNALRHFVQLLNTNFVGVGAVHVSLTYKGKFLPSDPEAAEHDLDLWLRRVAAALKVSEQQAARIPRCLLAAILMPMPVPQMRIPSGASPSVIFLQRRWAKTG